MTDAGQGSDPLQFDKAEFDAAPAPAAAGAPTCTFCGKALRQYWAIGDKVACAGCHDQVQFLLAGGSPAGRFARATVFGVGAGIAGAFVWYLIGRITGLELGIIAIALGWAVGSAVRHGSENRGGWPYQLLAVALTYVSLAAAQLPTIASVIQYSSEHPDLTEGAQLTREMLASVEPGAVAYIIAIPFAFAAPFLGGIMGVIIAGIALYYAFQTNRKLVVPITGPHEVGTGLPPPAPAVPTA